MAHLIDKDTLVMKIESKRKYAQTLGDNAINSSMQQFYDGMKQGCVDILSFLDTLEVKEVDLEKEYEEFVMNDPVYNKLVNGIVGKAIAKHFFELGMAVNNSITASDRGTAEEIIISLKQVENDYHIDHTKEIEWVRNKVKKG